MIEEITIDLAHFLLGYIFGFISAWVIRGKLLRSETLNMANTVALAILIVWVFSMIIDVLSPDYETSPLVQGLMGSIVGFFYKQQSKK